MQSRGHLKDTYSCPTNQKLFDIWPRSVSLFEVILYWCLALQKRVMFTLLRWPLSRYAPLLEIILLLNTPSCCDQVLTGVLPYHGSSVKGMIANICAGERPSRPINSSQGRLLQNSIWNVINTGWHNRPERRCKPSSMYHTFSQPSQRGQLGKILPRVASFFQFLQNSEPETQKRVNEMNEVSFSASSPS